MKLKLAIILWLICGLSPGLSACADPGEAWRQDVDSLLEVFDGDDRPGLVVAIERNGEVVFAEGYGMADLEHGIPITPESVFHVASVSKQFTAFSIALLEEEGRVDADADIRTYLAFMPDYGVVVRVRHLIHHTSGLRSFGDLFVLGGHDMEDSWHHGQVLNLLRRQTGLDFQPGTEHSYNNSGYALLAEIVSSVTGQSLREFTRERIFEPLSMDHTFVGDETGEIIPGRALAYVQIPGVNGAPEWQRSLLNFDTIGSTGLKTTALDLLKWGHNFSEPTVGTPELIEKLSQPGQLENGALVNYGYGLAVWTVAGHRAIRHSGSEAGYRAVITHFPESDVTIVMLANTPIDLGGLTEDVAQIYLGEGHEPEGEGDPAIVQGNLEQIEAITGVYQPEFGRMISLENQSGRLTWNVESWEPVELVFREDGSFEQGGRRYWEYFTPVFDASRNVTGLTQHTDPDMTVFIPRVDTVWHPGPAELEAFTGDFYCADVDQTYSFSIVDGQLVASSLWSDPVVLKPSISDRFDGAWPLNSVVFDRDDEGMVMGLHVHSGRVRNMWFEKVSADDPS